MKYVPPIGSINPEEKYVDRNGKDPGSPVPAASIEHPQREIVHAIKEAGLTPDEKDLTQLAQAIRLLASTSLTPGPEGTYLTVENGGLTWKKINQYDLCEFYFFRHPTLRSGFQPAQGGLLANAATLYPKAWDYLKTVEGQKLCKTETEWQAMTTATWATLASGAKVGWDGIGGAPFYAPHTATGALRLPDLRGMYAEAAGFDALGVGAVHGDAEREKTGSLPHFQNDSVDFTGVFKYGDAGVNNSAYFITTSTTPGYSRVGFRASLQVPTAAKNQPRAWGALACVYLGLPS